MIERTQAIVLRYAPYSNTSRVVTWLTPDFGKIVTVIKGSQRPKSPFLGQYDLYYTCELLFYGKERDHIHIARECSPLKTREGLRSRWGAAAAASYFADLAARVSPADAPNPGLFEVLDSALDHLADNGATLPFVFWFELRLLELMGLTPRLTTCLACGCDTVPGSRRFVFSQARGGLLCGPCGERSREPATPIAPDVMAMLSAWQSANGPTAALNTRCTPQQVNGIRHALGLFLPYHLETPLASRDALLEALSWNDRRMTAFVKNALEGTGGPS